MVLPLPHLFLWVRFPGPQGSPAHLDTPDWLLHGDLREAQSWARPHLPVSACTGKRERCELRTRHPCVYSKFLGRGLRGISRVGKSR